MKLNGIITEGFAGKTVEELIEAHGYKKALIAVEYNEEILPKSEYENTILKEEDVIEVVSFVGGG